MGITKNASTKPSETNAKNLNSSQMNDKNQNKTHITRVIVHYDVGLNNSIYIRGSGAGLSWDKGTMLHNTQPDEWVFVTEELFSPCEFKVLINDSQYEKGDNHPLVCKNHLEYTPAF